MLLYKTIKQSGTSNYRVLGSRHLGFVFEVQSELQAKEILKQFKQDYHDATHVCHAFRLGPQGELTKFSDDGEPSGTAGKPMAGALMSAGLTQVLALVVRYYGGTKLGTGGLIQAYRTAVELAIEEAGVVEKEWRIIAQINCSYEDLPGVMQFLKSHDAEKLSLIQLEKCELSYSINASQKEALQQMMLGLKNSTLIWIE
jgi:uncharacterized YigZ family protein